MSSPKFYNPIQFLGQGTFSLSGVMRALGNQEDPLNIDPDYQRGHVWTRSQQERFMGHLLEGGKSPEVIVNRDNRTMRPDEVVDGKQRITAIVRWMTGEIAGELSDGRLVWRKDLTQEQDRYLTGMSGPSLTFSYVSLNRQGVLQLYLRLNRGGTVHTDEEIQRVRDLLAQEGRR